MSLSYRLGLDLGTNSIGWCAIAVQRQDDRWEASGFLDWGVRVFDDGREPARGDVPGESSAVQRRTARGMRRRYDRITQRKQAVMSALIKQGLMPKDKAARKALETRDPLALRARGVSEQLEPHELGRALFHLQQRRGFKSNRKDARQNEETSSLKFAAAKLEQQLYGQQTLGEYLHEHAKRRQSTRFHARTEGNKTLYDAYPTRQMVEDEFNRLWEVQRRHHPALLTDQAYTAIHHAIFFQRPLKPQPKGVCSILKDEQRMAWAMPAAQRFRIAKEIANLRILRENTAKGEPLTHQQRKTLYEALCKQQHLTFNQARKLLGCESHVRFNLESENRKRLEGDRTAHIMRGDKKGTRFPGWDDLPPDAQEAIVARIICDDPDSDLYMEDEAMIVWLQQGYGLSAEQAEKAITAPLPEGYAKYGQTVIRTLLTHMLEHNSDEYEAITANGWQIEHYDGQILEALPYYGELLRAHVVQNPKASDPMVREHGRIGNPTVHIALNQLKRLMNTLKQRYGCWPQEIVIEVARDLKKGRKEIADITREIGKNTKLREQWRKDIAQVRGCQPEAVSGYDLAKMKLWHELEGDATHRKCVFTGETISIERLLSDEVEIEHILPRSQTLDDTSANKTLATRVANRMKGNQTPYQAFKDETGDMAYERILERAALLPKSKQWRFKPDAMERFNANGDFAARQLNDTSYIARLAREYLYYACDQGKDGVVTTPGTLTGLLRKSWGLHALFGEEDAKNRNDHRHHAVDALVVAMTTRSMIQKVSRAAGQAEVEAREDTPRLSKLIKTHIPKPWQDFEYAELQRRFDGIVVSHKPDHGTPNQAPRATSGQLHEDTYYGYIDDSEKPGYVKLVRRVPLLSLTKQSDLNTIRDPELREALQIFAHQYDGSVEQAVKAFAGRNDHKWPGIQRVRVVTKKSKASMVPVKTRPEGTPWKMAKGGSFQRMEIFCPDATEKWDNEVIHSFEANQPGFVPRWRQEHPKAKLVMTLHQGDMVCITRNGQNIICRVKEMNAKGGIYITPHFIATKEKSDAIQLSSINVMQKANLRRIYVECDGSIYDPAGELTTAARARAS